MRMINYHKTGQGNLYLRRLPVQFIELTLFIRSFVDSSGLEINTIIMLQLTAKRIEYYFRSLARIRYGSKFVLQDYLTSKL